MAARAGLLLCRNTVLYNVPLMVHTGLVERNYQNPEMPVRFYRTEAGGSPVLDWLRGLDKEDRHAIFHDQMLVGLHGFIKKTQKTPTDDLALAKRRMKEVTK
jgi:hypothetical protein